MMCIDKETATAYVSGYLDALEAQSCASHIARCSSCLALVEQVSDLLDGVRRVLLTGDDAANGIEIPPLEAIMARSRPADQRLPFRLIALSRRVAAVLPKFPRQSSGPRWAMRFALSGAALFFLLVGAHRVLSHDVVHASEVIRRSIEVARSSRTIPDRIIHKVWKDSLVNSYGPLPDGDYHEEYWWDNVENRVVHIRRDSQDQLREALWQLKDGTTYAFVAYDLRHPELVIGPTEQEILNEIEQLPPAERDRVSSYYSHSRRPLYELAQESLGRTERQLTEAITGRNADSSVHEVIMPSGQKLYRVTSHIDVSRPESVIPHWDVTRLIVDQSYLTLEIQSTGYRSDGLIYQRTKVLLQDEMFVPGETDLAVFEPGPFPKGTVIRHITAKERVQSMQKIIAQQAAN